MSSIMSRSCRKKLYRLRRSNRYSVIHKKNDGENCVRPRVDNYHLTRHEMCLKKEPEVFDTIEALKRCQEKIHRYLKIVLYMKLRHKMSHCRSKCRLACFNGDTVREVKNDCYYS